MGFIKDILGIIATNKLLFLCSKQTIFLTNHLVNDIKVDHIKHLYQFKNTVQFHQDCETLQHNYQAINIDELLVQKTIPENSFLLTFDDGLAEIYKFIFPILNNKNIKAIFFINPNFVNNQKMLYKHKISLIIDDLTKKEFPEDKLNAICKILDICYNTTNKFVHTIKNTKYSESDKLDTVCELLKIDIQQYLYQHQPYITKSQIQEMIDAGYYFGGHTMSHPRLNELSHEQQKAEILQSINWLKSNFDIQYSMFAFPFTDKNISRKLINELFAYDQNILIFGNSGLKRDIDPRIIQRFSLENPKYSAAKTIVVENLYKYYNMIIGKYKIIRK